MDVEILTTLDALLAERRGGPWRAGPPLSLGGGVVLLSPVARGLGAGLRPAAPPLTAGPVGGLAVVALGGIGPTGGPPARRCELCGHRVVVEVSSLETVQLLPPGRWQLACLPCYVQHGRAQIEYQFHD
jgi:hypothetical protein